MQEDKYFLAFFDCEGKDENEEVIQDTIEELFTDNFKNRSLKISRRVLLIKGFEYSQRAIESNVEDAFSNQIRNKLEDNDNDIKFFVLPVVLNEISQHLWKFEKELEYLKTVQDL